MVKSKAYVLMQIKDLQMQKFGHTEEDANAYAQTVQGLTVYELLVLKKELVNRESPKPPELPDVSTTRWFRGHMRFEEDE
jgi:hypothetical protein|tara:strand:- start:6 stop:245 length:240 start_codon:yes stop_codon:yes gene_type:complete